MHRQPSRRRAPVRSEYVAAVRAVVEPPIRAMMDLQLVAALGPKAVCNLTPAGIESDHGGAPRVRLRNGTNPLFFPLPAAAMEILSPFLSGVAPTARVFAYSPAEYSYHVQVGCFTAGVPIWCPSRLVYNAPAPRRRKYQHRGSDAPRATGWRPIGALQTTALRVASENRRAENRQPGTPGADAYYPEILSAHYGWTLTHPDEVRSNPGRRQTSMERVGASAYTGARVALVKAVQRLAVRGLVAPKRNTSGKVWSGIDLTPAGETLAMTFGVYSVSTEKTPGVRRFHAITGDKVQMGTDAAQQH